MMVDNFFDLIFFITKEEVLKCRRMTIERFTIIFIFLDHSIWVQMSFIVYGKFLFIGKICIFLV